jgi:hypothetical protein
MPASAATRPAPCRTRHPHRTSGRRYALTAARPRPPPPERGDPPVAHATSPILSDRLGTPLAGSQTNNQTNRLKSALRTPMPARAPDITTG